MTSTSKDEENIALELVTLVDDSSITGKLLLSADEDEEGISVGVRGTDKEDKALELSLSCPVLLLSRDDVGELRKDDVVGTSVELVSASSLDEVNSLLLDDNIADVVGMSVELVGASSDDDATTMLLDDNTPEVPLTIDELRADDVVGLPVIARLAK